MTNASPEVVPFSSSLRHRVRAVLVRAPEVQDARFQPGPAGAMPLAAIDHANGLLKSGLKPSQVKYLAELHPVAGAAALPGAPRAVGETTAVPLTLAAAMSDLGDSDLPAPVRRFGDGPIEVQPKPATFMQATAERSETSLTPAAREARADYLTSTLAPRAVSRSWSDESVDAAGAERAQRDEETCARLGLALPPAFFALGTTLVDAGVDNARKSRESFEALPRATEACAALEAEVVAEDRRSIPVGLSDLRVTPRGELTRGADPLTEREGFICGVEEDAMQRLQADLRAKLGAGGDLGVLTGLRFKDAAVVSGAADMWNLYAAALKAKEAKGAERKQVSLLTRMVDQGEGQERRRQVFAAVSEKYGEVNAGKIARACGDLCASIEKRGRAEGKEADVRAEVVYDRSAVAIDLLSHTTVGAESQVVGDVFRTGLRVRSDDTGSGSLTVRAVAYRVACRNYTVVSADGAVTRIRHVGDPQRLLERLQEALQASSGALATFAVQWGKACGRQAARHLLASLETERKRRDELADLAAVLLAGDDMRSANWQRAQAEVLDGIYRSILVAHDLAPAKAIEEDVRSLVGAYHDPRNAGQATALSPAAISNGLTLWAQGKGRHTADAAEVLAGRVVSGDEVLAWLGAPARAA